MTPAAWVADMAARTGATPTEARRVLACLTGDYPPNTFEPLPTGCGHPSSVLRRDPVRKGHVCPACRAERGQP